MELTYELTDNTRVIDGVECRQIRSLTDRDDMGVIKGGLGAWVPRLMNAGDVPWIDERSWADPGVTMSGHSRITDGGAAWSGHGLVSDVPSRIEIGLTMKDSATIRGGSVYGGELSGWTAVWGMAEESTLRDVSVPEGGEVHKTKADRATISGSVGQSEISRANIAGEACILGGYITGRDQVFSVPQIGSQEMPATMYRTKDGHRVEVGCWKGQLEDLWDEVEYRRRLHWDLDDPARCELWLDQYRAFIEAGKAHLKYWETLND